MRDNKEDGRTRESKSRPKREAKPNLIEPHNHREGIQSVEEQTDDAAPAFADDEQDDKQNDTRWEQWPKLSTLVMGKFRR